LGDMVGASKEPSATPAVKVQGQQRPAIRLAAAGAKVAIKGARPVVRIAGNFRDDFPPPKGSQSR